MADGVAISGGWRKTNEQVEREVRAIAKEIIVQGNGLVTGGALGVDYIATDEALIQNSQATQIKIYLPTTLQIYAQHYRTRASEGVITLRQAEDLISQLERIVKANSRALMENPRNTEVNQETYYKRNSRVIEAADELVAFHINNSEGTQNAIQKARQKGIPIRLFTYTVP